MNNLHDWELIEYVKSYEKKEMEFFFLSEEKKKMNGTQ